MKSFFKKLAFVMALAMVVSMIAPAGSALAATTGVSLQGTKTIVDSWELDEVGATVDFSFQGAPSDWKSTYKWTSSNEAVATVDKAGIVTAVAAGTATITITAGADASYVETVVVIVNTAKAAFEVAQLDTSKFTMTFDAKKDVKVADVTVQMTIANSNYEIPAKTVTVNEKVATVELYSEFIDGVAYTVTYAGETQTFTGSIGEIDHVAFEYYTGDDPTKNIGVAYVSTDDEPSTTTLVYKLYDANNVDVTKAYKEDDFEVAYELATESDAYDLVDNELVFLQPGAAVINLSVTWTAEDGEDVVKPFTGVVVGTKLPELAHTILEAGFIRAEKYDANPDAALNEFVARDWSFVWGDNDYMTQWVLGDNEDDTFQFAALVEDNRGNKVVTGLNAENYYEEDEDGNEIYPYGYFTFESSNDKVVMAQEDGRLAFINPGTASIVTYFNTRADESEQIFVGATKVTVLPERVPTTYAVTPSLTIATDGSSLGDQRNTSFVLTVLDQYGKGIELENGTADITVETTSTSEKIPVKENFDIFCSNEKVLNGWNQDCSGWWCGNSQGQLHYHINFTAEDFRDYVGKDSNKTLNYAVTIDKEENPTITTKETSKIKLVVKNNKKYADELDGGEGTPDKYYYAVKYDSDASAADLAVRSVRKYQNLSSGLPSATKSLALNFFYYDANGFEMAAMTNIAELTDEDMKSGEAGKLYYKVEGPKKAYEDDVELNWGYNLSGNQLRFTWNSESADHTTLDYAATGNYTVSVWYLKNNTKGKTLSKLGTYTFNISNSQADPVFAGFDAKLGDETEIALNDETTLADVVTIIKQNLEFTYEGAPINWDTDGFDFTITEDDYRVKNNKLYISKITIEVPCDATRTEGEGDDATTIKYNLPYYKEVKVNETIDYKEAE